MRGLPIYFRLRARLCALGTAQQSTHVARDACPLWLPENREPGRNRLQHWDLVAESTDLVAIATKRALD
jgi:hypothetical protein